MLLALGAAFAAFVWMRSIGGPGRLRERYGWWGLGAAVIAHGALNLTPAGEIVPSAVANGAIWGLWLGAGVNWLGWIAASVVQYTVLRKALRGAARPDTRLRPPAWLARVPVEDPIFQILGRSVPWVGLHVVNVGAAMGGVAFPRFLLCAAVGQAAPSVAMAALGAGIGRLL